MYENGVRARVIERIMGWAPRQMYERQYLRVADQQMHDAIRCLYAEDPICDRQRQALQPVAVPTQNAEPSAWLAAETAKLGRIDNRTARGRVEVRRRGYPSSHDGVARQCA
jgi:hypothetical protein